MVPNSEFDALQFRSPGDVDYSDSESEGMIEAPAPISSNDHTDIVYRHSLEQRYPPGQVVGTFVVF